MNNAPKVTEFLFSLDAGVTAISVISYAEILTGLDAFVEKKALPLLHSFQMLEIDATAAAKAAALRRQYNWKLPDAFQAAICHLK